MSGWEKIEDVFFLQFFLLSQKSWMERVRVSDADYQQMIIDLSLDDISKLCETGSYFRNLLCQNSRFWWNKFKNDYPALAVLPAYATYENLPSYYTSWKQVLIHVQNITRIFQIFLREFLELSPIAEVGPTLTISGKNVIALENLENLENPVYPLIKLEKVSEKDIQLTLRLASLNRDLTLNSRSDLENSGLLDYLNALEVREMTLSNQGLIITQILF